MTEALMLWVFRRHAGYPKLHPGFNYVTAEEREAMIADQCGQDPRGLSDRDLLGIRGDVYYPTTQAKAERKPPANKAGASKPPAPRKPRQSKKSQPRSSTFARKDARPQRE